MVYLFYAYTNRVANQQSYRSITAEELVQDYEGSAFSRELAKGYPNSFRVSLTPRPRPRSEQR